MSDFIQVAGWTQHSRPSSRNSVQHLRSLSSSSTSKNIPKPTRPVSKSISSSALHTMATVSTSHAVPSPRVLSPSVDEEGNLSTLPDPRSRAMSPANDNLPSPSHHPDLSNEVATLSTKLINAINHQTNLDDSLTATRHDLETARERIAQLEQQNKEHTDLVVQGVLVKKTAFDLEKAKLVAALAEEKRQRGIAEQEKKKMEQDLENLSISLFEEANKMVIQGREEAQQAEEASQKRIDQLKAQLADTEGLLKSQQEQLSELKHVMEQLTEERDDQTNQTAPSTPGLSKFDSKDDLRDPDSANSMHEPISPSYPTSFTHLLQPVLRTDLSAYEDFTSLLKMSKNVPSASRVSSGSYSHIGLGLGLGAYQSSAHPSNGSTTSLSTSGTAGSSPTTPASTASNGSTNGPNSLTPLKDTKFYKRALAEDIEPTLRLDAAPGLSWLARRTVLNAVCDGNLVVEPLPSSLKQHNFPCALCGENRKDVAHTRSHRFRTSENENAQRYPLCRYCHGRVRSTCDLLGFLRILKDGHWRADNEESERAAWEESVRLREQMFWCRMGGGVVPTQHVHGDPRSPRISEERKEEERKISEEVERTGEIQPKDITPGPGTGTLPENSHSAFVVEGVATPSPVSSPLREVESVDDQVDDAATEAGEAHDKSRDSTPSATPSKADSPSEGEKEGAQRLSITIPGSFD
ncbi:uncharacterized protein LY89DRAFT_660618 [Mollisia scopiformis]|uniref:GDP/GTP exchange factor Sec2 N-terminal domain-containing protein n=1 Tax=Mollisia scopiformis TaxID=149040 RepID=A0A132B4T3_MOLSC|nr:uncharacterized protein LY89DRAFT_660618 [Mollisia scopiformis]KUJ07341.1 hypothetical protein LY89DRAFT_660618 [Mollisia scopiformis]